MTTQRLRERATGTQSTESTPGGTGGVSEEVLLQWHPQDVVDPVANGGGEALQAEGRKEWDLAGPQDAQACGGWGGCWKSGKGIAGAWSASLGEAPRDQGQLTVQIGQSGGCS